MSGDQPPDPKWQQVYDRLVQRARDLLDDPPALQRALDAADVRAEGFRELREELAPLRRMVLSHTKGSYSGASKSELSQAVAAIWYVAWPLDLIPDHLPWGLKDDASFVRYIKGRLSEPLATYAAWENSLDALAPGDMELLEPQLPPPAGEMEITVLDRDDGVLPGSGSDDTPPLIAVQQLAQSSKAVRDALHSGRVIRVLGPKHLLKGLDSGSLELVSTSTGKVGTVRDATSKRFAGQLRLGKGGAANAAKMTVSAGFAVASAVTMQYYLASIDSKLGSLRHGLEGLQSDVLDEQLGKIDSAHEVCRELQQVLERTGRLGSHDLSRLVHADSSIDDVFKGISRSLERFASEAESMMSDLAAVDKNKCSDFLKAAAAKHVPRVGMLIYAAGVRDRVNALRVLVAAEDGDERVQVAEEAREREHREMYDAIRRAFDAIETVHIPKRRLDETWPHLGGPEKELASFVAASKRLRGLAARSVSSNEVGPVSSPPTPRALPTPEPTLTELWIEDGSLRAAQVAVRSAA